MEENNDISLDTLDNNILVECYEEVESFLKKVDEEIKKTDVGNDNE